MGIICLLRDQGKVVLGFGGLGFIVWFRVYCLFVCFWGFCLSFFKFGSGTFQKLSSVNDEGVKKVKRGQKKPFSKQNLFPLICLLFLPLNLSLSSNDSTITFSMNNYVSSCHFKFELSSKFILNPCPKLNFHFDFKPFYTSNNENWLF